MRTGLLRLLALCLLSSGVYAGEALTLSDALQQADKANEQAAIARERLLQADGYLRMAYAELLPQITAGAVYTPWSRRDYSRESTQANLRAELQIFDPASIPRIRSARRWHDVQHLDAHELRRSVAFETANAYVVALAAKAVTTATERRLAVAEEALRQARLRADAGLAERAVVLRTELEATIARTEMIRAENVARVSQQALNFVLGTPAGELLTTTSFRTLETPTHLRPLPTEAIALLAEAREQRKDLQALNLRAEARAIDAEEPVSNSLPKFLIRADATYDDRSRFEQYRDDYRVSLVASWSLYDGGARYGEREALLADARAMRLQAIAADRQLGLELASALSNLTTANAAIEQARARKTVAEANATETAARFKQGLATALEQADASVAAFEADIELTRSQFAAQQATLSIEQAIGRWPGGVNDPANANSTESTP